jgi:hypothetical protein
MMAAVPNLLDQLRAHFDWLEHFPVTMNRL